MNTDQAYTFLTDFELATEQEINLVIRINGYSMEQLENILYVRTGYRSFEQYAECEMSDYDLENYGIVEDEKEEY